MAKEYELYNLGDWAGLYIDGHLVTQGHRIDIRHVLEELNIQEGSLSANKEKIIEAEEEGNIFGLPDTVEELVSEYGPNGT